MSTKLHLLIASFIVSFLILNMGELYGQAGKQITYKPDSLVCTQVPKKIVVTFNCFFNGKVKLEIANDTHKVFKILSVSNVVKGVFDFKYKLKAVAPDSLLLRIKVLESDDPTGCALVGKIFHSGMKTRCKCGPIITLINKTDEKCYQCKDGFIHVEATGMKKPIKYEWDNGLTGNIIMDLEPGSYFLKCTGANKEKCSATFTTNIEAYQCPPTEVSVIIEPTSCNKICDGYAEILGLKSGAKIKEVEWSDGSKEYVRTDLCAGNYTVIARSKANCPYSHPVLIEEPDKLTLNVVEKTNANEPHNGKIKVKAQGGSKNYQYFIYLDSMQLMHDSLLNVYDSLAPGCYRLEVRDLNGCSTVMDSVCVENSTATTQVPTSYISVYPNPASSYLYIENHEGIHLKSVSITNDLGEVLLMSKSFIKNGIELPSQLSGIYQLEIVTDEGIWRDRIVIIGH